MNVYIVEKQVPAIIAENNPVKTTISFTEGVFDTEQKANEYIVARINANDEDDKNCSFVVSPWLVQ